MSGKTGASSAIPHQRTVIKKCSMRTSNDRPCGVDQRVLIEAISRWMSANMLALPSAASVLSFEYSGSLWAVEFRNPMLFRLP